MTDEKRPVSTDPERLVDTVRERYGRLATTGGSCCGPSSCCGTSSVSTASALGYDAVELESLPPGADLGLGCGAPLGHLELREGETVVDLGSGAGIDAQLAARQVGPSGTVIGVDMTPEMLDRARSLAAEAGLDNVELREGRLEALPVQDGSVDAVTSNCVINLVPDKAAVFREVFRVLRPGGRAVVSDIVLDGELPEEIRTSVMAYVGCVAGAMARDDYLRRLHEAGLEAVEILKDVDFLELVGDTLPEELTLAMDALDLGRADLAGVVRSITWRARRPVV